MSRRAWIDLIVTTVVGIGLAVAVAWAILGWMFSGWGDPSQPTGVPTPTVGAWTAPRGPASVGTPGRLGAIVGSDV